MIPRRFGRGFNSHRLHHPFFVLPVIWASPAAQQTPKRVWSEEPLLRGSTGARHRRAVLVGALMVRTFGHHLYELGGALLERFIKVSWSLFRSVKNAR